MTDGSNGSTCRFDWKREEAEEGIKRKMEEGRIRQPSSVISFTKLQITRDGSI